MTSKTFPLEDSALLSGAVEHTVTHFIQKQKDSGLLLIDVPTGIGKTTKAKEYILNHYKERTIFYVTPLKNNLQKTYEELEQEFKKVGKEDFFRDHSVLLLSNLEMFDKNIDSVASKLDLSIRELEGYQDLMNLRSGHSITEEIQDVAAQYESLFRSKLYGLLKAKFKGGSPVERLKALQNTRRIYKSVADKSA